MVLGLVMELSAIQKSYNEFEHPLGKNHVLLKGYQASLVSPGKKVLCKHLTVTKDNSNSGRGKTAFKGKKGW